MSLYRPPGDVYDSEGNIIGESYGNTNWDYIALVLFGIVSRSTFKMICGSLEDGLRPEYSLDIFAINLLSQIVLSFTRYGWWIYALVPGYIGMKITGWIWSYLSSRTEKGNDEAED